MSALQGTHKKEQEGQLGQRKGKEAATQVQGEIDTPNIVKGESQELQEPIPQPISAPITNSLSEAE